MSDEAYGTAMVLAAQESCEVMSAVCQAVPGEGITAPVACEVLGSLRGASGYMLIQVLQQLGQGLQRSVIDPLAGTGHDDGSEVSRAVLHAQRLLDQAAGLASDLSDLLAAAQMVLKPYGLDQPPHDVDQV